MTELAKIQKGFLSHLNQNANSFFQYKTKINSQSSSQLLIQDTKKPFTSKHNFKRDTPVTDTKHKPASPIPNKENIKPPNTPKSNTS